LSRKFANNAPVHGTKTLLKHKLYPDLGSFDLIGTNLKRPASPTNIELYTRHKASRIELADNSDAEADIGSDSDEESYFAATNRKMSLKIDDAEGIKNLFYANRFKRMHQLPCKMIAKAWIKVIEPKKQAKFPYNGGKKAKQLGHTKPNGEVTRPPWWPLNQPHKEPDHIRKTGMLVHNKSWHD
jgi:hypothetical protein